jgi:Ca2+-binding RTX toxin-like protein
MGQEVTYNPAGYDYPKKVTYAEWQAAHPTESAAIAAEGRFKAFGDADDVAYASPTAGYGVSYWMGGGNDVAIGGGGRDFLAGEAGDDFLIGGGNIDVLDGGAGADVLWGGEGDDYLHGWNGDDILQGGEGADILEGGAGFDIADYSSSPEGVTLLLAETDQWGVGQLPGTPNAPIRYEGGDATGDRLIGIEGVIGSRFPDVVFGFRRSDPDVLKVSENVQLIIEGHTGTWAKLGDGDDVFDNDETDDAVDWVDGGPGDDRIWTGGGDDVLIGGPGGDLLDGEDGFDTVDYLGSDAAVVLRFAETDQHGIGSEPGTAFREIGVEGGDAEGDTLYSIEAVVGSRFDDLVYGPNTGRFGAELGGGHDVFDNDETHEAEDFVDGGPGRDRIWTGPGPDTLIGGGERDYLFGEDGDDILVGGPDNDTIDGGRDLDVAIFAGQRSGFSINGNGGVVEVEDRVGDEGRDTLTAVEILQFDDGFLNLATNSFTDGYANDRVEALMTSEGFATAAGPSATQAISMAQVETLVTEAETIA